jgi:hypothetical protein
MTEDAAQRAREIVEAIYRSDSRRVLALPRLLWSTMTAMLTFSMALASALDSEPWTSTNMKGT